MASATDIITYIGIPLAVLGVLPIIYTFFNSLITTYHIRKAIRKNGLDADTRSSLLSGIFEVALPRYSIIPLDREDEAYWELNSAASMLKGGSWTILKWNRIITGQKLYRLRYSDELQVPQAEVDFEELLDFLLDRGAVLDVKGLRMLRISGLWTPAGTSLMLSPSTTSSVLRVGVPDDSDGVLSMTLSWDEAWNNQASESLPPNWMRLGIPQDSSKSSTIEKNVVISTEQETSTAENLDDTEKPSEQEKDDDQSPTSIRIHVCSRNNLPSILTAQWERDCNLIVPIIPIDHITSSPPTALYFTSTILALSLLKPQHQSLHTTIPPSVLQFATQASLPAGVLVLLGLLAEADAPSIFTTYDPHEDRLASMNSLSRYSRARQAEMKMSPADAMAARTNRQREESASWFEEFSMKRRRDQDREALREREALGSGPLDVIKVAEKAALWLVKDEKLGEEEELVESWLIGVLKREEIFLSVIGILERWVEWVERGGMKRDDLTFLKSNMKGFCYATTVVRLLKLAGEKEESSVALDMKECVKAWKKVRLG